MPKARLTERQNDAYEFIRTYIREYRKPPTLMEIGASLGIASSNGVYKLLQILEQKGYIRRDKNQARGLHLVEAEHDPFAPDDGLPNLPVISRTTSDQPAALRERPRRWLTVDPFLLGRAREEDCLLVVAGDDGMNGDGIRKGDVLLIEEMKWNSLRNDEIVAALIGENVRVRRFDFANEHIHLRPSASEQRFYNEEKFSPGDPGCHVIGRVLGVMRKL